MQAQNFKVFSHLDPTATVKLQWDLGAQVLLDAWTSLTVEVNYISATGLGCMKWLPQFYSKKLSLQETVHYFQVEIYNTRNTDTLVPGGHSLSFEKAHLGITFQEGR